MAATLPPNSLLARARSTRSNAGKPSTQSQPIQPTAPTTAPPNPTNTSNISLFLTNLRLLDLDSLSNWPEFDAQTFLAQKKRIQSVEWALYQLFVLWDPEEAHAKLDSYFPPRDQVSSLNLRAALLRCLEQAKKNGVLGRDAVVRKTMLDECKGERLEEVLAVFSSAVLKKLVAAAAEAEGEHPAIAQQLALETRGYSDDRTELVALALAYKASLCNLLRSKDQARKQYDDLSELLDVKERSITRRREQAKAQKTDMAGDHITRDVRLDTWRMVRNNWTGDEQWMETILHGDTDARSDGVLSAPFDRVWRRVQSDRLSELEDHGRGLLEKLDSRVKAQQESLQKRQDLQQRLFGPSTESKPKAQDNGESRKRGINFGFNSHEKLHVRRMSLQKQLVIQQTQVLTPEYASLLDACRSELAQIGATKANNLSSFLGSIPRRPSRPDTTASVEIDGGGWEDVSDLSDLEEPANPPPPPPPQIKKHARQRITRPEFTRREFSYQQESEPAQAPEPSKPMTRSNSSRQPALGRTDSSKSSNPPPALSRYSSQASSNSREHVSRSPSRSPERQSRPSIVIHSEETPSPDPVSPTQELADQILESMNNASPSPVKQQSKPRHTLSLADRTRLSMARMPRGGSSAFEPEEEEESFSTAPRTSTAIVLSPPEDPTMDLESPLEGETEDLASRTRRSMAGFEAARQKAQVERRRSLRKSKVPPRREGSYFPKVEEEDDDTSMLAVELMDQGQQDMEAIFKSRPRLQTSPAPSPRRAWDQDEYD